MPFQVRPLLAAYSSSWRSVIACSRSERFSTTGSSLGVTVDGCGASSGCGAGRCGGGGSAGGGAGGGETASRAGTETGERSMVWSSASTRSSSAGEGAALRCVPSPKIVDRLWKELAMEARGDLTCLARGEL